MCVRSRRAMGFSCAATTKWVLQSSSWQARKYVRLLGKQLERWRNHAFFQVRFDVFSPDLNFDKTVDWKDFAYFSKDWAKHAKPGELRGDITGEKGLPDGRVDFWDLELYAKHYLKDIEDPNTW